MKYPAQRAAAGDHRAEESGRHERDVWKAYHQLQTYKDEIADLLVFNEALVVSDGMNARVGSPHGDAGVVHAVARRSRTRTTSPALEFELEKVVRGFFRPDLFLDYLRYFVLFEQDGDALIKKIAGYHQFHGSAGGGACDGDCGFFAGFP